MHEVTGFNKHADFPAFLRTGEEVFHSSATPGLFAGVPAMIFALPRTPRAIILAGWAGESLVFFVVRLCGWLIGQTPTTHVHVSFRATVSEQGLCIREPK